MRQDLKQIIRFPALKEKLGGVSRSTIFRWERDKTFPRHIQLGPKAVGWDLNSVNSWLDSRHVINGDQDDAA